MRRSTLRLVLVATAVLQAAFASHAAAQGRATNHDSDLLVRFNGPVTVGTADTLASVWVFGDEARVVGTVSDHLVVVNGRARVDGTVHGTVVVINGHLDLGPYARVGEDVMLYRSTVTRDAGALVAGEFHQETGVSFSAQAAWFLWFSMTLGIIVAALALMYLAQRPIIGATRTLSAERGATALTAALLLFGLPMLAVASIATGVGLGIGLFILLFALPALAFAGYVVVGARLGDAMLGAWRPGSERPYWAVTIGVFTLQVVAVIPVVGGILAFIAAPIGAGALVFRSWRNRRSEAAQPAVASQPGYHAITRRSAHAHTDL